MNPLVIKISMGSKNIGTMSIGSGKRLKNGSYRYEVAYKSDGKQWEAKVSHRRVEGALKLTQKACLVISKQIRAFYSIPEDKIRALSGPDSCVTLWDEHDEFDSPTETMYYPTRGVKHSDIPERYQKELMEHLGVHTATSLEGESVVYLNDLEGFLTKKVAGIEPMWD